VQATADVQGGFALHQNYPNPFNPSSNMEFRIANVSAEVGSPPAYMVSMGGLAPLAENW
jgi:hypothetical protein